jgi:histidine triad (HIT) family protein
MDCVFCKIINGQIPSEKIYEDENFFVILDINPINKGHLLVLPKKHYTDLFDMDDTVLSKILAVIKKLANDLKTGIKASGINVIQNNGKDAGQIIFHSHFHIIPRFAGDGINIGMVHGKYADGELAKYGDMIRAVIRN